ncbi:YcgJ family protein [Sulfurovum riftiae]|uniref:Lipoprotein n=1 Tax=Sulfurovum riftiae TaxID=1630136 RepID=A0A151CDX5_9BACT|nr:YcgJ family protein [Sulfurovum riftiae]KYJ85720.1 hypothetical protein AS592_02995 [Sulfurovum riftiae]
MKKTALMIAATAMIFGLSGCTDAEMAQVEKGMKDAQQQNAPRGGAVYFPERGIVCDKKAGFCADSTGISMGYTKEYLGQAAQDKMMGYVEKDHMETGSYTMSNGVYCDSAARACYNNKWKERVDSYYTSMLFR